MIISEVVLLIIRQVIPVVPLALFTQFVLPLDVEQENDGAEDTEPDEAET
jgi:hypothetical protein